jgi:cytochrome P450
MPGRGGKALARETAPVEDWTTDFEILDPGYIENPAPVWDQLRRLCPVARSERHGGAWLLTSYADVTAAAHDVDRFSSLQVGVLGGDPPTEEQDVPEELAALGQIDGFIDRGHADAAAEYSQQIPVRVIAHVLGVPEAMADDFTGWVRDVLEFADEQERSQAGAMSLLMYLFGEVEKRRAEPGEDLISELIRSEHDGQPLETNVVLGMVALVLVAGIDTTWSGIGSAIWHLATHPEDSARLAREPELVPAAVEELLRAYSPVTMARVVVDDTDFAGCPMHKGDKVLMNFPAANRDPAAFERAGEVILDRAHNRHVAFGVGIHRCAGSNLARMELKVAVEEWVRRIPSFQLEEGAEVTWAGGQVRGPRSLPVTFP